MAKPGPQTAYTTEIARDYEPTTLYEKYCHAFHYDSKWIQDQTLGRRIGLYKLQNELGRGNFSYVKQAMHELTQERVAIKVLDKAKLTQKAREMLDKEITSMESVHHPNIIRLYEVVETYTKIHLVMELAPGGELFQTITTVGKFIEPVAKNVFIQLCSALKHLHERNIIHRDIKAENVFMSSVGNVKLGDFGFSTQLLAGPNELLHTFCGSPPYAAPELFRDASYVGGPVDVWALGVLLFFMTTGHMPFPADSISGLKRSILLGIVNCPAHLTPPLKALIRAILRQAPAERLTVDQIMESDWVSDATVKLRPPDEPWSMLPTVESDEPLSEIEQKARQRLEVMGITSEMMLKDRQYGGRSQLIAAYRIIVHRLQYNAAFPLPPSPPRRPTRSRTCVLL